MGVEKLILYKDSNGYFLSLVEFKLISPLALQKVIEVEATDIHFAIEVMRRECKELGINEKNIGLPHQDI